ncbi:MAG: FkbM family methyltransferase [Hydrococcus sp. C42_A2020_068]|uniref:FkbM family methyltransferase n=1 Tax=Pleurocapsa sp. PCC 7327 TaxID=118163 RepID=UPI00029FCCA5|nr:FkbM family methyltransferase [Pleurocapsa sp. PCC 7327]AFY77490.1 methyltransferase, FkbM family [Pleurocapsa sp. PCC 7327]MBF2022246.1 FkbM family methyltransferase [Hydrococcus sp. C42_A2020_068]
MQFFQKLLLGVYSLIKKTGLLEKPLFNKGFWFAYFLYKQYFEDPFFGLTQKYPHLFKEGCVLDIGANIGYTTTVFSKVITPGFKVYAFEPDRVNFNSLREMVKLRKAKSKIVPVQAAMGETKGEIELWHNENHHGDHRILTQDYKQSGVDLMKVSVVPMWSVDEFVASEMANAAVKFIKIDVQGYELPVCLGMQQTLAANPDVVVAIEYMPSTMSELGFAPETIFTFFQEQGYFMYLLHKKGKLKPARQEVIDKLVKNRGYTDLIFSKRELLASS